MNPRKPTQEEKDQLIQYLWQNNYFDPTDEDKEWERDFVENAAIAVFDHYQTDSPGYVGKVMVVVWSAGPGMIEVFVWRKGMLAREEVDTGDYRVGFFTREELQVIVKTLFSTLKEWPENLDLYQSIREKVELMLRKE